MPDKIVAVTRRYWFQMQPTLGELLAMPCKIVCQLTRYLVYPAILILDAINLDEVLAMLCKIVRLLTSKPLYPVILFHDTKTVRKSWRKIGRAHV